MPRDKPPFERSELLLALQRGMRSSTELNSELQQLDDAAIETEEEAEAVCEAAAMLASLPEQVDGNSPVPLANLFESVKKRKSPVFQILAERGIPSLVRIVQRGLDHPTGLDRRDLLLVLKVLAQFRTRAGTSTVLRAARVPLHADSYMWHSILGEFARHPHRKWLYARLSDPIPPDAIGISLLNSASMAHDRGAQGVHPFSSPSGIARLCELIADEAVYCVGHARSAVCAIPFLNQPVEDELLSLAFDHPSPEVQLEAAWAAAKMGRAAGLRALSRACLDANLSDRAKYFLEQLDQEELIPAAANDEHFLARATFANWLAHPCELGCPPDEVEIVDHRMLRWPPDDEPKPFWLVKYRVCDRNGILRDDVDTGLVGSVTFCLFNDKLSERPPEDAYAIHCYWELTHSGQIVESSCRAGENYGPMLAQYPADDIREVELETVCELSAMLNYPQQLVGIARCRRGDDAGWVILDGPRSRFYPAAEMPRDSDHKCVLMLHVGRGLLGFGYEAERRPFLQAELPPRDPAQFVKSYERLLERERTRRKPAEFGILTGALDEYANALCRVRHLARPVAMNIAYTALIELADNWELEEARDVCSHFSPLATHFAEQVETLVELGRENEVLALISRFRAWWDKEDHLPLAKAAVHIGQAELAREMLQEIATSASGWCAYQSSVTIAELWVQLGDHEHAQRQLVASLAQMRDENFAESGEDSKAQVEGWFQENRSAYLRLFPKRGEADLKRHGIPESTL